MKTIISGIDGSPGGRSALRVAAELSRRLDARLVAVHVRTSARGEAPEQVAADIVAEEVPDLPTETRGATGDVATCLAEIARHEEALMIVVGARRRGRSRAFLRARSAVGLAGLTDIPVLVAPLPTGSAKASPASPASGDGSDGASTERARPVRSTVEEQRRLRRMSGTRLPGWSRGRLPGTRSHS